MAWARADQLYGFSYGTYLGRSTPPCTPAAGPGWCWTATSTRAGWYDANRDHDVAFARNIKLYFAWLAQHHESTAWRRTGAAVEKLFYATQRKLSAKPAGGVIVRTS